MQQIWIQNSMYILFWTKYTRTSDIISPVGGGGENMHLMTKDTYKVFTDSQMNMKYLKRIIDEETKDHKTTDQEITKGFMPEIHDSKHCHLWSYPTYLYSLSDELNVLWQNT